MQCSAIQHNTMPKIATQCNAKNSMQFSTIQYNSKFFKQLPGNLDQCNETAGQCSEMQCILGYNTIL